MNITQWQHIQAHALDDKARQSALQHQAVLTKPPGALGELEKIAIDLAAMQGVVKPECHKVHISIFAADHGVAKQGVSAFPQEVTSQMILNFATGGAAVAVLARQLGADFEVINLGTVQPIEHVGVIDNIIAPESGDISQTEAMSEGQLLQALAAGRDAVQRAVNTGTQLFLAGEMGIANTTSASALIAALMQFDAESVVGPGTGVSPETLRHKAEVVNTALRLHLKTDDPLELLRRLGGFEIAAMVGAYLSAAEKGIPLLIDGFISSTAAYLACQICPGARNWMLFGHASAEPCHRHVLSALNAQPMLTLGMRLGEGSGAAVAVNIIRSACALHNTMATFNAAGVSDGSGEHE
ncbi:MAG: nicotinate-nucleotide--dimethylbenzimidazole phosphoribosyltransferase [Neptuniibacter caesariensis]|uniref:Nicotinate-nucleotide--dimethylbenzimidazole phosphoribosyltransferase n=1 Tax=Neptuniibacter caesariensis TaxID=207954 RepID=A0A2G6JKR2_NEPCE|nr:MAG: nicotinate-nucleotide--dimethylbenzimidazole phosphoribosyltransferase [Neptuniibacter caesariensis]